MMNMVVMKNLRHYLELLDSDSEVSQQLHRTHPKPTSQHRTRMACRKETYCIPRLTQAPPGETSLYRMVKTQSAVQDRTPSAGMMKGELSQAHMQ